MYFFSSENHGWILKILSLEKPWVAAVFPCHHSITSFVLLGSLRADLNMLCEGLVGITKELWLYQVPLYLTLATVSPHNALTSQTFIYR